jgi:hypothetical protein
LAWAVGLILGPLPLTHSTRWRPARQPHARIVPAPRHDSSRDISWSPNQSALTAQPGRDETPSTTGPARDSIRRANFVALFHTVEAPFEPSASLELSAPSAFSGRTALSGAAKPPDDPASALLASSRPARPRFHVTGVALAVLRLRMRCGRARRADKSAASQSIQPSRLRGADCSQHRFITDHQMRAIIGETDRSRSAAIRHIKRHRFTGPPGQRQC